MSQSHQPSDFYGAPSASQLTAVLGPTNTGKTHLAIERMLGHQSGLIGLPLRLLAREVYDRIVEKIGPNDVALITGEEKIKPKNARYWVSTVEAMPRDLDVEFVAVDEIQLAGDPERGHVFTDRLFHMRGSQETLLLGSETMRPALGQLLPGVNFISRPRLSKLTYAGPKKISRLPRRSAIVAFSSRDVYEIAEFVRRQRGGAAVVLGALSPRTRNAQVEMYQSGDVDYLVATDAIGMGLNLDVHHVAFAGNHKFDGAVTRQLFPHEIAQIAGRAGRHIQDGTFGVTSDVPPFSSELIEMVEGHEFDPVRALQWRAGTLDFANLPRLLKSLKRPPQKDFLVMARDADDVKSLEAMASDPDIQAVATNPHNVQRVWQVCQVPDYRKISPIDHHELIRTLLDFVLKDEGQIPEDWMAAQLKQHDNVEGDIDSIAARIAYIRTWTFIANRPEWLKDPEHWQEKARAIENKLSDALHEGLTKRFVDQRTSTLMKRLRENDELYAEIDDEGKLMVEDHFVGELAGFQFTPDHAGDGVHGRAARAASVKVLNKELMMRSKDMIAADKSEFQITPTGDITWREAVVGRLLKGDHILKPNVSLLADEQLSGAARGEAEVKLQGLVDQILEERLGLLLELEKATDITGLARGVAFQLVEQLGILRREPIANDIRQLDQEARGKLRKFGIRFGAFHIYFPLLLKPAASEMARLLWLLFHDKIEASQAWVLPRAGLTSAPKEDVTDEAYYLIAGFSACGRRVVRIDMLERLADIIRPLVSWRDGPAKTHRPLKKQAPEKSAKTDGTEADSIAEGSTVPAPTATEGDNQKEAGTLPKPETKAAAEDTAGAVPEKNESTGESVNAAEGSPPELCGETEAKDKPEAAKMPLETSSTPQGATGDGGFTIQPQMMSIMGCSAEELGDVLHALGFRATKSAAAASGQPATGEGLADGENENKDSESQTETAEIIIWRPRKKSGGPRGKTSGFKRPAKHKTKKGQAKGKEAGPKSKQQRGKPYQKAKTDVIDPDSPFAKLAFLKSQIEDKAG